MSPSHVDRWAGLAIAVAAAVWCWGVVSTIPVQEGVRFGARGFPMSLGVLLGILGLAAFAASFRQPQTSDDDDADSQPGVPFRMESWAIGATVVLMVLYAFLLEYTGLIIATVVTTAFGIGPVVNVWRPRLMAALSLGMAFGIYLVLGKIMGVYLPHGRWINFDF